MNTNRLLATLPLALLAAGVLGCGSSEEPAAPPAIPTPARAATAPQTPAAPKARRAAPPQVAYQPPYPNRTDLFTPPQKGKQAARQSDAMYDDAIALIGFVAVDQPKAVLSIDGVMTSLAAGAQRYGIQVISIAPPEVTLQRGRNRWTASLD